MFEDHRSALDDLAIGREQSLFHEARGFWALKKPFGRRLALRKAAAAEALYGIAHGILVAFLKCREENERKCGQKHRRSYLCAVCGFDLVHGCSAMRIEK